MESYIWQLIIWGLVLLFGSPLGAFIVGLLGVVVAAIADKPAIAAVGTVVAWAVYVFLAIFSLFHTIRSLVELIQYASA